MHRPRFIQLILFALVINSCNEVDRLPKTTHNAEVERDSISSIIFLNGSDLEFKLYSRGCFHTETQRLEISKKENKQIVISYFRNEVKVLDKKAFDSSFQVYIKSFIYECDRLLKDTASRRFEFATIETIQISDGLDIINVGADISKSGNPFSDLVYSVCHYDQSRLKID